MRKTNKLSLLYIHYSQNNIIQAGGYLKPPGCWGNLDPLFGSSYTLLSKSSTKIKSEGSSPQQHDTFGFDRRGLIGPKTQN